MSGLRREPCDLRAILSKLAGAGARDCSAYRDPTGLTCIDDALAHGVGAYALGATGTTDRSRWQLALAREADRVVHAVVWESFTDEGRTTVLETSAYCPGSTSNSNQECRVIGESKLLCESPREESYQ